MLSIREIVVRPTRYGDDSEVIVVGPRQQLEELAEMYDKPMSGEFWGVPRSEWSWERDGSLRLGFSGSESEARNAISDAIRILGGPRPNPLPDNAWFIVRYERETYAAKTLSEAVDLSGASAFYDHSNVEWAIVKASDAGAARLMRPKRWRTLADIAALDVDSFRPFREPRQNPHDASDTVWACTECNYQGTGVMPKRCPGCKE